MPKYHISPTTGTPAPCRAQLRACPLGGPGDHYDSPEAARSAYERKMSGGDGGGTFATLTRGGGPEPEGNAGVGVKQGPELWVNPPSTTSTLPPQRFAGGEITPRYDSWETYRGEQESGVSDNSVEAFAEVYGDSGSWAAAKASAPQEDWVQRAPSQSSSQSSIWDEPERKSSSDNLGRSFAQALVGIGVVSYLNKR